MKDDFDTETVELPILKEDPHELPKVIKTDSSKDISTIKQPLKRRGIEETVELPIFKDEPAIQPEYVSSIEIYEVPKEELQEETIELPNFKTTTHPILLETIELPFPKEPTTESTPEEIITDSPIILDEEKTPVPPKKDTSKKIFKYFVILVSLVGILYSIINIITWKLDNVALEREIENINTLIEEVEVPPSPEQIIPEQPIENPTTPDQPISIKKDYSRIPLIDVDFTKLKEINPDTKAFLKVKNLDISIPVVQTTDNSYYLKHSFEKKNSSAGWVFGDYRNDWDNLKSNTIIYGHNLKSYALFGSLKLMYNKDWYGNKDNHIIYLSTEKQNLLFEIFSVYDIETETYYLANEFSNDDVYREYLDTISSRSAIKFDTKPTINDKILTLSTCRTSTSKTVVHARLVKMENK